jgi:hypothetical protein
MTEAQLRNAFDEARAIATIAGQEAIPTPMVVTEVDILDKPLENGKSWYVSEGVCGFAWVNIQPGTCKAARYAKKHFGAKKDYHGGVSIWVYDFGQSMTRKEAYARAFANTLRDHGITAYAQSRMD